MYLVVLEVNGGIARVLREGLDGGVEAHEEGRGREKKTRGGVCR